MTLRICNRTFQVVHSNSLVADKAGVYVFLRKNYNTGKYTIIYVGRTARQMFERIKEHKPSDLNKAKHFGYCVLSDQVNRVKLEKEIYDKYEPELNDKRPS